MALRNVEFADLLLVESAWVAPAAVRCRRTTATAGSTTVEATTPTATTATATAEVATTTTAPDTKKLKSDVLFVVEARFFVDFRLQVLTLSMPGRTKAE